MAFLLPVIQAISGVVGITTGIKSIIGGDKKASPSAPAPTPKPLPAAPKPEDAQKKAEESVARRRRISVLSGGETNVTRGQSLLAEGDVGVKKLLGA